jgi:hypothetical protein
MKIQLLGLYIYQWDKPHCMRQAPLQGYQGFSPERAPVSGEAGLSPRHKYLLHFNPTHIVHHILFCTF